jgi:hypothetical protein
MPDEASSRIVEPRAVDDPDKRFAARVASCGSPPAVLALTPVAGLGAALNAGRRRS